VPLRFGRANLAATLLDASGAANRSRWVERSQAFDLDSQTDRIAEAVAWPDPFASSGYARRYSKVFAVRTSNTVGFSELGKGIGTSAGTYDSMRPPSSPVKLSANVSGSTSVTGSPQADYKNCCHADRGGHLGRLAVRRSLVVGPIGADPL
jgi:hypothetical protein